MALAAIHRKGLTHTLVVTVPLILGSTLYVSRQLYASSMLDYDYQIAKYTPGFPPPSSPCPCYFSSQFFGWLSSVGSRKVTHQTPTKPSQNSSRPPLAGTRLG